MSGTLVTVLAHAARSKLCSQLRRLLRKPLPFFILFELFKKEYFFNIYFSGLGELSLTWPRLPRHNDLTLVTVYPFYFTRNLPDWR